MLDLDDLRIEDSPVDDIGLFGGMALAVAPSVGRFRPAVTADDVVQPGQVLGHVVGGSGRADEVRAPVAGQVRDLLVRPGQTVALGQGLAWLERVDPTGLGA